MKNKRYKRYAKKLKGDCHRAYDLTADNEMICDNCSVGGALCNGELTGNKLITPWHTDLRYLEKLFKDYNKR